MALTVKDIIDSSGKYPERAKSPELTLDVKTNIEDLVKRVNNLLNAIWKAPVKVSSGFRTSAVNSGIHNAAKKSLHMNGQAVDIFDPDGKLKALVLERPELLADFGLWMEDPAATPGWQHLDTGKRSPRSIRIFKP